VLGFLSVSTEEVDLNHDGLESFQSRAGFSECLDPNRFGAIHQQYVSIPCWVF